MSTRLEAYLAVERVMLSLDDAADPLADRIRDLMDPIWYGLTNEEHAVLDARPTPGALSLRPVQLAAGSDIFLTPTEPDANGTPIRDQKIGRQFSDWRIAV